MITESKRRYISAACQQSLPEFFLAGLLPLLILVAGTLAWWGNEQEAVGCFLAIAPSRTALRNVLAFLTQYGNIPFYLCYAYLLINAVRTGRSRKLDFVVSYLVVLVMLLLVVDILKIWVGRPRPGIAVDEYISFSLSKIYHSFPSNHMSETALTTFSLALFYRNRTLTYACGLWIVVMGVTRLCLGRHYPTDLLGSAFLGVMGALLVWKFSTCCPGKIMHKLFVSSRMDKERKAETSCV